MGRSAGKLLFITAALAYGFTLASGFFSYAAAELAYPFLLSPAAHLESFAAVAELKPYFTVAMPAVMDVMSALVLAFTLGLGMSSIQGNRLKGIMLDFRDIIDKVILRVIIPLLPYYIFGIFLNMTVAGQVGAVLGVFAKIIVLIFAITAVMLILQFVAAGIVARKNPLPMLKTMLVAYVTALGTQSSAATIPVTLKQAVKIGVREAVAGFVVPLCATIHLSGSTMKIVACALAILFIGGQTVTFAQFAGFICMLGVTMVAAPGVWRSRTRPDDCAVYCDGLVWYGVQRNGRRRDCGYRQQNLFAQTSAGGGPCFPANAGNKHPRRADRVSEIFAGKRVNSEEGFPAFFDILDSVEVYF